MELSDGATALGILALIIGSIFSGGENIVFLFHEANLAKKQEENNA